MYNIRKLGIKLGKNYSLSYDTKPWSYTQTSKMIKYDVWLNNTSAHRVNIFEVYASYYTKFCIQLQLGISSRFFPRGGAFLIILLFSWLTAISCNKVIEKTSIEFLKWTQEFQKWGQAIIYATLTMQTRSLYKSLD